MPTPDPADAADDATELETPAEAATEAAEPAAEAAPDAAPEPDAFPVSLDEACRTISRAQHAPEMIAAFHYLETAAGRMTDTEAAFRERYDALANPRR